MTGNHNLTQLHLDTALRQCQNYILLNDTAVNEHPDVTTVIVNLCPNNCSNRGVCSSGKHTHKRKRSHAFKKRNENQVYKFLYCLWRTMYLWLWVWRKRLFLWRVISSDNNKIIWWWCLWQIVGTLWGHHSLRALLLGEYGNKLLCDQGRGNVCKFVWITSTTYFSN